MTPDEIDELDFQFKLHTGLTTAVTVLFRLLDAKGVLSRREAVAALKDAHDETVSGELKDEPNLAAQTMAFRALMLGLSDLPPDADDQTLMDWLAGTQGSDS